MKYLILIVLLTSCGIEAKITRKLRRAEKLTQEAIALGAKVQVDTVFQERIIPGAETRVEVPIDRILLMKRDTVIYQDRIRLQYRLLHDTLRLNVVCPPDTIKVPVTVTKSILCPPASHAWRTVSLVLIGLLTLIVVFIARK